MHLQNVDFRNSPAFPHSSVELQLWRAYVAQQWASVPHVTPICDLDHYRADHFATFRQEGICCEKMPGSATPTSFARSPAGLVYSGRLLKAGRPVWLVSQNPRS
jgi:hypothetical protein